MKNLELLVQITQIDFYDELEGKIVFKTIR